MNILELGKAVLDRQQRHWDRMYTENTDMFGNEPSYPARRAAEYSAMG